jgi:hypothetical protein
MQNDERDFEQGDLAEIWRSAQHRRTVDVGRWLADYFRRQRRLKSSGDRSQRTHKLIAAYVMFACVAALLSVNLTSPTSAALGADWQCSRFALVFTSCTPVRVHEAVSAGMHKADLVHDKPDTVLRMSVEISGHTLQGGSTD